MDNENTFSDETFSDVMFFDYRGMKRSKSVLEPIGDKVTFDASSIYIGVGLYPSDMFLIPDEKSTITLFGRKIYAGEMDSILSPRRLLKKTLAEFKEKGLGFKTGIEPEFYLTKEGKVLDKGTYLKGSDPKFSRDLLKVLAGCGLKPNMSHHEVGPGQYEFGYDGDEPVKTGDSLGFFKSIVRNVAVKWGYNVTFMPKPFINEAGNGMHTHVSVWETDGEKEENLFSKDEEKMMHFLGGLIAHAKEISALVTPSVNSYKRLGASEAPAYITWGHMNRSALVRIPRPKELEDTRLEFRAADCSANPYLAFTAIIRAGMDGMDNEISPGEELRMSSYDLGPDAPYDRLPFDLTGALMEFKKSEFVKKILPEEMRANYIKVKGEEIRDMLKQVTEAELESYWFV